MIRIILLFGAFSFCVAAIPVIAAEPITDTAVQLLKTSFSSAIPVIKKTGGGTDGSETTYTLRVMRYVGDAQQFSVDAKGRTETVHGSAVTTFDMSFSAQASFSDLEKVLFNSPGNFLFGCSRSKHCGFWIVCRSKQKCFSVSYPDGRTSKELSVPIDLADEEAEENAKFALEILIRENAR